MEKDTAFYDAESAQYSGKRYPARARTFTQFFFKERLRRTLGEIGRFVSGKQGLSVLEVGCADGVVARAIWKAHGGAFSNILANDIAPEMVRIAQERNADTPIHFEQRTGHEVGPYDLIIEIGVLNFSTLKDEYAEVERLLAPDGRFICSLSSTTSLQHRLKGSDGYRHLRSYREYEKELTERFDIVRAIPVGFFVPWLWKMPPLGRLLQPLVDHLGAFLMPNGAHEKVYVLARKRA